MFADDRSVFLSEKNVANLQAKGNADELLNIDTWLASNKLSLNIDKTNFMLFKTKATNTKQKSVINLTLRDKSIKQVFDTKFLGLTLDETLSWKTHTQSLLKLDGSLPANPMNDRRIANAVTIKSTFCL